MPVGVEKNIFSFSACYQFRKVTNHIETNKQTGLLKESVKIPFSFTGVLIIRAAKPYKSFHLRPFLRSSPLFSAMKKSQYFSPYLKRVFTA